MKEKYNNFPTLKDQDYDFLDAAQTIINNPGFDGDPELERDRIFAASIYANALNQPMDVAYQNLDIFHEQWTGQKFIKKTGVQAVMDSFQVSFLSQELNSLAKEYHNSGQDPEVLKAMQEVTGKLNGLRDNVPKIWQEEYVRQGGWADVGASFRSITTSVAENIVPMGIAIGAGVVASTGVGAIAELLALPAGLAGILTSGASMVAMAETTASQTVGLEYFDLISQGIPDDIAWTNANISAQIQGAIEALGGGVVSGTTRRIINAAAPSAIEKAVTRWFIKGKMGAGSKALLEYFQEVAGEAFEEGTQQITSIAFYNRAAEQANTRRDEMLERIYAEPLEDARMELEKELEKHPEIDRKEFEEAWKEVREATIGGLGTAILLGIPGSRISYSNNIQAASRLANMAQTASNEGAFIEAVNNAKEQGFENPFTDGMRTDEQNALLSDIYKVQQERLTPEQREAKQKAVQDAAALAEVTDYRNAETIQNMDEETGETRTELSTPDVSNIYRENNRLEINEYTDINEDGSVNGRFVAGDPRIEDKDQSGINQYGYINYTKNGDTVTIDDFKMLSGFEDIRSGLYQQFAERFAGQNIVWNPQNEQNITLRDQLINLNPRGPKEGLNYYERQEQTQVSNEAQQIAQRFTPYMKNSTPLEVALAAEAFSAFYRRRGESLNGAMNRLLGSVTNEAPEAVRAAQREGKTIKGATWLEHTVEGMRRIVYLNKNAADGSTVLHETSHAVANDFTDAERNIAARALNGYQLKNGTTVYFDENGGQWTDEQHEAFAEALENYFTNGTAPNEQIKSLFEKIKEFMKRVYQTMRGWTELSPQVEQFYKDLFSGELVEQARAETASQTHEDTHNEAQNEKTINNTNEAGEAATAQQEASTDISHQATLEHIIEQMQAEREAIINSPDIPLEEKTKALFDAAGEALWQTGEAAQEQINAVYEQYHNEDGTAKEGWLKAPNGEDTNLTENQWLAVRTLNFKNWFGDWENDSNNASKIIDQNGEPLVVYHGTSVEFDTFSLDSAGTRRDSGLMGKGFYFSTDKKAAVIGDTKVISAFINARNPLDLRMEAWKQDKTETVTKALGLESKQNSEGLRSELSNKGNDAVVLDYSPLGYLHKELLVLNPEQIKSATDNTGTFDPNNPSTLFQTAYQSSPFVFEKHDNSNVGRVLGNLRYGWGHYLYSQQEAAEWFRQSISKVNGVEGQLYEVDIPGDNDMLHWEKPISEQAEVVQKAADQLIAWNEDGVSNVNTAYNLRQFDNGGYGFYRSINGKMKWATRAEALAAAREDIKKTLTGQQFYNALAKKIGDKNTSLLLDHLGVRGAKYLNRSTEKIGLPKSYNYVIYGDSDIQIINSYYGEADHHFNFVDGLVLLQTGDRNMIEEAADFEDGKDYRGYVETFHELPQEVEGFTNEQIDVWFDEFVKKAKQAVNSTEAQDTIREGNVTPADLDREFNEMISGPGTLEEFVEIVSVMHNEDYSNWGAIDEEDAATRNRQAEVTDNLRRKLTHPTWQSIFKAQGKVGQTQRKQLLTMIQNSPREYRSIYAEVMEREDMAVSAEDTTATALKYRITDSRRQDIDSLTPEKLRQLAEELDIEDFAEKVRTGRAEFNDPIERAYIKQLQDQRQKVEETLKEVNADREDDNNYIERLVGKQFNDTFERALKAREEITRRNDKLDRSIQSGERDAARIVRQVQRAKSNYDSIVKSLEALAEAQQLEIDVQAALSDESVRSAARTARSETREIWESRLDALQEEFKDYRKSAKTEATLTVHLTRKALREELRAHLAELKERQKRAKALTQAKRGVTRRILRPISPREVNAEQGQAIAIIQRFVEPSMLEGIDRFIGGIEKPYLRTIFETWKVDEQLRADIQKNKAQVTKDKMNRLFSKERYEDLTNDDKKYLYLKIPPNDWAAALGLESIINRRNENYPGQNGETERQIALKYLPSDVYYRIMEKPFSEWTLQEGEELAKIIDDLTIKGKEIYKANIDAERRRISEYQSAVRRTIRIVGQRGFLGFGDRERTNEEVEEILGKYDEGVAGTAQAKVKRNNFKGPLFSYADMNIYRFARMLDNGDINGKNSAALYRRASDAYNSEKIAVDTRTAGMQERMKTLEISESELWQKSVDIALGGDFGIKSFTASELLGFISATRDDYSRNAVMYGNLLSENERGAYQRNGITNHELAPLYELAEERFAKIEKAAQRLIEENPKYQQLMNTIDNDFTVGGQRLSEALVLYNNTYMPIVEQYFPMHRQAAVSVNTADAQLARDLMGGSSGAFNLFVEKGFVNKRQEIPAQYQTGIDLDILGVWAEAVNKEEHFIAYGQLVKDLNGIYKQSRQVKDAIQRRYGQHAVDYINKYINELANPNSEKNRSSMDNFVKTARGNLAAAYLSWKASGIVKQFITSPAPFFAHMNPIEYWGTFVDFVSNQETKWNEIIELSAHMKHRSANLLTEIVKEQAKQKFNSNIKTALTKFNKKGMEGLEWIDRMCVAPGWLVLFRKEYNRLTNDSSNANINEKDIRVKAAQYADDIVRQTQPSSRVDDLAPFFKGNNELTKTLLQFSASLNVIWQNIRYDLPQMIRDRRYKNAAGTIIGYTLAGIMLGAITAGFDEDADEATKMKKIAWWSTTQFTDAFPIIGSEATHIAELLTTGKMSYSSGINLFPALQKGLNAGQSAIRGIQQGDFEMLLKAAAQAAEAVGISKGLPISGIKELEELLGIDDEEGLNLEALLGRR